MKILQCLRWIDRNLEKVIITICYALMSGIIFVEVIRRFVFHVQAAWSTQIPIYLFLMLVWIGCAYNAKVRTHLTFPELRVRMPYTLQMICLVIDYICWMVLACLVMVFTLEQVEISRMNYAMVLGTELYVWYFYCITPIGWLLVMYRVTQNLFSDIRKFREGAPLVGDAASSNSFSTKEETK